MLLNRRRHRGVACLIRLMEEGCKEVRLDKESVKQCAHSWAPGQEGACESAWHSHPHVHGLDEAASQRRDWLIERDSVC